jgi:hypothetical protein
MGNLFHFFTFWIMLSHNGFICTYDPKFISPYKWHCMQTCDLPWTLFHCQLILRYKGRDMYYIYVYMNFIISWIYNHSKFILNICTTYCIGLIPKWLMNIFNIFLNVWLNIMFWLMFFFIWSACFVCFYKYQNLLCII